ncbi:TPA: hypothetical protein N0F65_008889 [Lagenidium giganteum]|uniref:PH domain-containing protein n=1 Tax=Lagenidium giganteum TaxID=4803 RepID=A0AAV2YYP3_9STRA|nr:TPA: hypothetical protein N0F65_008889 [Lagenidium giganteum]
MSFFTRTQSRDSLSSAMSSENLGVLRRSYSIGDTFCSVTSTASTSSSTSSSMTASLLSASAVNCEVYAEAWMFWLRGGQSAARREGSPPPPSSQRFTKVYAVLRNEFLFFYRADKMSVRVSELHRLPLLQIAVARSCYTPMTGAFHVEDPHGETMELYLYDRNDENMQVRWEDALEQAADMTDAKLAALNMRVDALPRRSMYRGSLQSVRRSESSSSLRETLSRKVASLKSLVRSSSTTHLPRRASMIALPQHP